MFDRWEYTIPADTSEANKKKRECKISTGVLTGMWMFFPAGCHGLARSRVILGSKPIMPRSPGHYVAADDMAIVLSQVNEPIKGNLPFLSWECWNVDDTYPHTLWLGAEWSSEDEPLSLKTYKATQALVDLWRAILRR